jgi:hypothetical protein
MKYISSYEKFKDKKIIKSNFYRKGKNSQKSIFEYGLLSEGFSTEAVNEFSSKVNFRKLDNLIIENLFSNFNKKEFIIDEFKFLNNIWTQTKNIWGAGIKLFGSVYNNFSDFLKNIGNVIGSFFKKIGEMFKALWEIVKTAGVSFIKGLKNSVANNLGGGVIKTAAEIIGDEKFSDESGEMSSDLKSVKERFQNGKLGNQSDELKDKLKDEAKDYDGVDNLDDVEKLANESFDIFGKSNFRKVYYCVKGYIIEGNSLNELILEADEKKVTGKMGVMGFFVEAIKLVMSPMKWLWNQALKLGTNGMLMLISAVARGGWNKKYNYKIFGNSVIKVKELVEGATEEEEKKDDEKAPEGTEDSLEEAGDINKSKKLAAIFGNIAKVLAPIFGALLVKYLEAQLGPVISILKWVLMAVSVFELIKILCQKKLVKGKVCSVANFQF